MNLLRLMRKQTFLMRRFFITLLLILSFAVGRAEQPRSGYRGFIEWSNDLYGEKVADWLNPSRMVHQTNYYVGATTSHGYQINPIFFVGLGLGVEHCSSYDRWLVPLFLQGRADFQFGRFTPFADLRAGVNVGCGVNAFFSPTVGYRFNWGRKMGLNVGLGMSLVGYTMDVYNIFIDPDTGYASPVHERTQHFYDPTFTFRIGIDF